MLNKLLSILSILNKEFKIILFEIILINLLSNTLQLIYSKYLRKSLNNSTKWIFIGEEINFWKLKNIRKKEKGSSIATSDIEDINK